MPTTSEFEHAARGRAACDPSVVAVLSAVHHHTHADTDSIVGLVRAGAIADIDCAVGDTPCLTASDDNGFTIDEAEVVYWGLCPACSTAHIPHHGRKPSV